MTSPNPVRVLFVCMGNICRSPTAHGVFEKQVRDAGLEDAIAVDSAGTHAYHVGEPPDPRARETAARRGIDLDSQRARRVAADDFERFDYVLAMDLENYHLLEELCPAEHRGKLHMFMDFARGRPESEVPDPYFGGSQGFERVFDMVEAAAAGLLDTIRRERRRRATG